MGLSLQVQTSHLPVMLRQEDCKFKANLGSLIRFCLKNKTKYKENGLQI